MLLGSLSCAIRRWAKRILFLGTFLFAIAMAASIFLQITYAKAMHLPKWGLWLSRGQCCAGWAHDDPNDPDAPHYDFEIPHLLMLNADTVGLDWSLPELRSETGSTEIRFPLWMPFFLFAITAGLVWYHDRNRPRPGTCTRCRYDLTGNKSGRCPECGEPVPPKLGMAKRNGRTCQSQLFRRGMAVPVALSVIWYFSAAWQIQYKFILLWFPNSTYIDTLFCRVALENGSLSADLYQPIGELGWKINSQQWRTFTFRRATTEAGFPLPSLRIDETGPQRRHTIAGIEIPIWPFVVVSVVPRFIVIGSTVRRRAGRSHIAAPQSAAS